MGLRLLKCPFCGYKAISMHYKPFDGYQGEVTICRIWCMNCHAQIEGEPFIKAMVDWNQRYVPTAEVDFDYAAEDI